MALQITYAMTQAAPDDANNWRGHAYFLASLKRSVEAMDAFDKAIKIEPRNADIYYDRGVQRAAGGLSELALEDYSAAIRLSPRNSKYLANRAGLYLMMDRKELAKSDAESALRLDPSDEVALCVKRALARDSG